MNISWNAREYTDDFQFVHRYGESVMELLTAPEGSLVIDLGCGNGALTQKLQERGYRVIGLDASADMLAQARKLHPELTFAQADAVTFSLDRKADAVFSNAVFHWIDDQEGLIANLAENIRPGGELVFEFGGKGCAETVHAALERAFRKRGYVYPRTFYFPTIGEYAPMLERNGFRVEYAVLFDRFTEQTNGVAEWISMFDRQAFAGVPEPEWDGIIQEAAEDCRSRLYVDGKWYVDYVRIRMRARRIPETRGE